MKGKGEEKSKGKGEGNSVRKGRLGKWGKVGEVDR